MVSEILRKGLLFAPLGAFFALAPARLSVPHPIRRILLCIALLATTGVATSIEMAQVFLAPRVPGSTDVILYTVGARVGMFVTLRAVDARHASG
jgi:VanZ family protein